MAPASFAAPPSPPAAGRCTWIENVPPDGGATASVTIASAVPLVPGLSSGYAVCAPTMVPASEHLPLCMCQLSVVLGAAPLIETVNWVESAPLASTVAVPDTFDTFWDWRVAPQRASDETPSRYVAEKSAAAMPFNMTIPPGWRCDTLEHRCGERVPHQNDEARASPLRG